MSRKMLAAMAMAMALSLLARRSRLKSKIVNAPKIPSPATAWMMWPLGIETKIATIPNAIRPSSAQNSVRAQAERSLRVAYRTRQRPRRTRLWLRPPATGRMGRPWRSRR